MHAFRAYQRQKHHISKALDERIVRSVEVQNIELDYLVNNASQSQSELGSESEDITCHSLRVRTSI